MRNSSLLWLAWRNLSNPQQGLGLSVMTFVSIAGVAIGVMALTIVLSIMGGFERDLKSSMVKGLPHLEVYNRDNPTLGFALKDYPLSLFEKLFPEATAIEPFIQVDVVLKHNRHLSSATLFAVEPLAGGGLWGFRRQGTIIAGKFADLQRVDRALLLGDALAIQLGASIGDELMVLNPAATADSLAAAARTFKLVGIFHTGLFNYDGKWAVIALANGRKFLPDYDDSISQQRYVSGVAVNFTDPDLVDSQRLTNDNLKLVTWKESNASLIYALKLEKFAMGAILMLIVLVAAFSISGTMMMTVFYRRCQIALLRALGLSRRRTFKVFIIQGVLIGTVGVAIGMILGLGVLVIVGTVTIPLSQDVYQLPEVPVRFLWHDYPIIAILAWLLSLIAVTYPAMVAAKEPPAKGLRFQ